MQQAKESWNVLDLAHHWLAIQVFISIGVRNLAFRCSRVSINRIFYNV